MQFIYLHGLNSNHLSYKGRLLEAYCAEHYPYICVHCPDLNCSPIQSVAKIEQLIAEYAGESVLVGSSLGGLFALIVQQRLIQHAVKSCKLVLLNPSLYPEHSFKRLFQGELADYNDDDVLYTTQAGWQISKSDVLYLLSQRPTQIQHADLIYLILQKGDEVLNYQHSLHYLQHASNRTFKLSLSENGDHVLTNFSDYLADIVQFAMHSA